MTTKIIFSFALLLTLFAFKSDVKLLEFKYPKNKEAKFTMDTKLFKKFTEEWRGEDYYYMSEKGDKGMVCSVLFYKLNANEQKKMVEPLGGMTSPGIPLIFFSDNSKLKSMEKNVSGWGEMTDDFMFRQNDIPEIEGIKINQKHMYAYAMFGKDLFMNLHLSKVNCTPEDSTAMRALLASLKK